MKVDFMNSNFKSKNGVNFYSPFTGIYKIKVVMTRPTLIVKKAIKVNSFLPSENTTLIGKTTNKSLDAFDSFNLRRLPH